MFLGDALDIAPDMDGDCTDELIVTSGGTAYRLSGRWLLLRWLGRLRPIRSVHM